MSEIQREGEGWFRVWGGMAWMILAVKAVPVVPGVLTPTIWSPTFISDSFPW